MYIAKTGKLQLDRAIVNREVGFYALSIALLYFALQDIRPVDYDEKDHIFISFADACLVFGGYIAYVLVCANMASVVSFASRIENSLGSFTSTPVISKQSSLNLVENDDEQNEGDVEEDRVLIDKDHLTIKIEHAKHKEQDGTYHQISNHSLQRREFLLTYVMWTQSHSWPRRRTFLIKFWSKRN